MQSSELQGIPQWLPTFISRLAFHAFPIGFWWGLPRQDSMCMPSPRLYGENVEQLQRSTVQIRENVAKPALVHEVFTSIGILLLMTSHDHI